MMKSLYVVSGVNFSKNRKHISILYANYLRRAISCIPRILGSYEGLEKELEEERQALEEFDKQCYLDIELHVM